MTAWSFQVGQVGYFPLKKNLSLAFLRGNVRPIIFWLNIISRIVHFIPLFAGSVPQFWEEQEL